MSSQLPVSKFSNLPPNGSWEKGSAPLERWDALGQKVSEMRRELMNGIEVLDKPASEALIQSVEENFSDLDQALQESEPRYPVNFQKEARSDTAVKWRSIEYRTGPSGLDLVVSVTDASPNRPDSPGRFKERDAVSEQIHFLMAGFEKIQKYAIESLQSPLPASQQLSLARGNQTIKEALEGLFIQAEEGIHEIIGKAKSVKFHGMVRKIVF